MSNNKPTIKVALVTGNSITVKLSGVYFFGDTQRRITGNWRIYVSDSKLFFESETEIILANRYALLIPAVAASSKFVVNNKNTIGTICSYRGSIEFQRNDKQVTLLNEIDIESFIQSILCVYFYNNKNLEFLKVQAILLRNSLLLIKLKMSLLQKNSSESQISEFYSGLKSFCDIPNFLEYKPSELLGLYRGYPKKCNLLSHKAVSETEGLVLFYGDEMCDTPQSVCCGGISETKLISDYTEVKPYLHRVCDSDEHTDFDLSLNENMQEWVDNPIQCYCQENDRQLIEQISNGISRSKKSLFRWQVEVPDYRLTLLLLERMKIDLGLISEIIPMERGSSGAIMQLRLIGSREELILHGQMLTHLREVLKVQSLSFMTVKVKNNIGGFTFVVKGTGWGFASGVCQMGAMKQATQGKNKEEILNHYFRDTKLKKQY